MSVHQLKADRVVPIQEIKHIYIYIYKLLIYIYMEYWVILEVDLTGVWKVWR